MFDFPLTTGFGAQNSYAVGRWTFKEAGVIVRLDGAAGDYLEFLVQDDISAKIDLFESKLQGHIEGQ